MMPVFELSDRDARSDKVFPENASVSFSASMLIFDFAFYLFLFMCYYLIENIHCRLLITYF